MESKNKHERNEQLIGAGNGSAVPGRKEVGGAIGKGVDRMWTDGNHTCDPAVRTDVGLRSRTPET